MSTAPSSSSSAAPQRSTRRSSKRISKDDKICQLKSELKISKEENVRLQKEIDRLKKARNSDGSSRSNNREKSTSASASTSTPTSATPNEEQRKKFREAMRALKKVTMNQEMVIRSMRKKAEQRRKELKQRDARIAALEQEIKSFETTKKVINKSNGDNDLRDKLQELQLNYDEAIRRKNDLEEMLDEKEIQMEAVQKQRNSLLTPLHKQKNPGDNNNFDTASVGSGSLQSVSTAGDFEIARLKTDLAKKSDKIVKLESDLEMVRDELYELQRKSKSTNAFGVGVNAFFPQSTFQLGQRQQHQDQSADDWTDADDTEDESEFGESFFAKPNEDNVDFW